MNELRRFIKKLFALRIYLNVLTYHFLTMLTVNSFYVIGTGIPDFYKLVATVIKLYIPKYNQL